MTTALLLATSIGRTAWWPHPKKEGNRREIEREHGPDQLGGEESGRMRVNRKISFPSSNLSNKI